MENRKKNDQLISAEEAAKIGAREAIKYLKEQEFYKTTKMYDRRLRNTRLLLKHYRDFKTHIRMAKNSQDKVKIENATDVLDDIKAIDDEEQYIQAISRTKIRTRIIVEHINQMLRYYKYICNEEESFKKRRYEVVYKLFIIKTDNNIAPTYEDIAKEIGISVKTISRDVQDAIKDLSPLLFGSDGLKL